MQYKELSSHSKLKTTAVVVSISKGFSESKVANRKMDTKLFINRKKMAKPNKKENLFLFSLYHENNLKLTNRLIIILDP